MQGMVNTLEGSCEGSTGENNISTIIYNNFHVYFQIYKLYTCKSIFFSLKTDSSIEVFNCKCLLGVWFQLSLQNEKTFLKCVSLYPKSSPCVGAQIHCKIQSCNFDSSFYVKCIISNTRLRRWLILHIILIKPLSNYKFVVLSHTTEEIVIETFK